mmetsp:Transcript_1769/g.2623  ORF Transcript_1769/g.2623 Transcript_1769/m.2623 type:complete len:368 (-) Transcript_1769:8-1111(-)
MSSISNNNRIESRRLVIPPIIAEIVEDARKHPERGHVLSRIHAHAQRLRDKASEEAAKNKRRRSNGETGHSSVPQNKFNCTVMSETPQIRGSVSVISSDGQPSNVVCSGYLVSAPSSEPCHVMIVLTVNGMKIPCLCPQDLIDFQIPATVQYIEDKRANNKQTAGIVTAINEIVESKPAQRGDGVHGQLILNGKLKGRVVDATMLESLRAGCLRIGSKSKEAFYTLDRRYTIDETVLKNVARVVIASKSDGLMKLLPVGREEVATIIDIANIAIRCKSEFHKTLSSAIASLHRAGNLPRPSLKEKLLQISMGGTSSTKAMMVGKFLSCAGTVEDPNINMRCACGFTVEGMRAGKDLLKRRCNTNTIT